jgi:hypothetical protein
MTIMQHNIMIPSSAELSKTALQYHYMRYNAAVSRRHTLISSGNANFPNVFLMRNADKRAAGD